MRKIKKLASGILIIAVVAIVFFNFKPYNNSVEKNIPQVSQSVSQSTSETSTEGEFSVLRVVDGDTIIIDKNGVEERVRLIGINTPESVHPDKEKNTEFGKKASEFTTDLLKDRSVIIELDKDPYDRYDRLLAYVYLEDLFINEYLVQEGYAEAKEYPPNTKYSTVLFAAQEEAKENKKGMWGMKNE